MSSPTQPTWSAPSMRKGDDFPGSARLEGQGLAWLGQAMTAGGACTVPVRFGEGWIEEPRLRETRPTAQAAEAFGRALAVTHAAGAPAFGAAPPGWDGRTRMGRSDIRLRPHDPDALGSERRWGEFYAEDRIAPYIQPGRDNGSLTSRDAALLERVCSRLADGDFDSPQPALTEAGARSRGARVAVARTHGDLWCGNVLWVPANQVEEWAPPAAGTGPQTQSVGAVAGSRAEAGRKVIADGAAPLTPHGSGPGTASDGRNARDDTHDPAATRSQADGPARTRGEVLGVLIDPLAQGAHAETDLAALGVFGQPYLERIVAGYNEVSALADGWPERVALHQLHMLMIHVFLFGGGYGSQAAAVARRYA